MTEASHEQLFSKYDLGEHLSGVPGVVHPTYVHASPQTPPRS